jgi:hypothetical protein
MNVEKGEHHDKQNQAKPDSFTYSHIFDRLRRRKTQ